MAAIRIGISGWHYPSWRGKFYPRDIKHRDELRFASTTFSSIEINASFYRLQTPATYKQWRDDTPAHFIFAVKGGRFITHMKKLRDVESALANFFASGMLRLGPKLGPILWQFPVQLPFMRQRFEEFIQLLPRSTQAAAKLAKKHSAKLPAPAWARTERNRRIRHAFEIRHPSFLCDEFIALLRKHKVALVFADTAKKFPYCEDITADFIYVRLHGSQTLYGSQYSDAELEWWAARIRAWSRGEEVADSPRAARSTLRPQRSRHVTSNRRNDGRDVYVYFDNDYSAYAPIDAMRLRDKLG